MSASSLQALRESFHQFKPVEEQDLERSKFLACCGKYYQQRHEGWKSYLDDDRQIFLKLAQRISRNDLFTDHPGSVLRLNPLAQRYLEQWDAMTHSFISDTDLQLSTRIDEFVHAHQAFVKQFIDEYKIVEKNTPAGAKINSPKTIKIFYLAAMDFLVSNPTVFPAAEEMFDEADPKLFDLLSYGAVLIFLKHEDFSLDELSELFSPFEKDINSFRKAYSALNSSDHAILDKEIFMQSEKNMALTKEGQELFRRIFAMVYAAREGENRQAFAVMNQALFGFLKEDFQLAKLLRHSPGLAELPSPAPHEDLVLFLSKLPAYDKLKAILSFLPPQEKLLQVPLFEIEDQRYFYRAAAIVALAQKLSDKKN